MKVVGYVVETTDSEDNTVTFNFASASHAESVVRALVHSGYQASISEEIIELSLGLANLHNFREAERKKEREERKANRGLGEESNMKIAHAYEPIESCVFTDL